jgi:hypothetical protein
MLQRFGRRDSADLTGGNIYASTVCTYSREASRTIRMPER